MKQHKYLKNHEKIGLAKRSKKRGKKQNIRQEARGRFAGRIFLIFSGCQRRRKGTARYGAEQFAHPNTLHV